MALAFIPIGMASYAWRVRLLPTWTGAVGRLVEVVVALGAITCTVDLVGAVHLFRTAAVVPTLAVVGAVAWYACRRTDKPNRRHDRASDEPHPAKVGPWAARLAIAAVAIVAADWASRTVDALHHGMTSADTLWYHLPFAARFVQQGTIVPLHYIDSEPVTVFFPANSELIHSLGIMFVGNDVLSPLVNLAWGAIALLAAWSVGRPFGVAPITLTGCAALLATPGLVATQPGGAYDDVVGIALFLACAALLITAEQRGDRSRLIGIGAAALAAGLALGTKFTYIAPAGALTVGVWILARRGTRLREGGIWLLLVALPGGFWYVRNLVEVGNPLPSLNLKLGPFRLPGPAIGTPTPTLAHFLFNGRDWSTYFFPGLRLSFGPAWWLLLGLSAIGLALGTVLGPARVPRMLAWVGLATGAAFIVSPQYLAILGAPVNFVYNVRYADPAVAFGLVLLPIIPALRRAWWPGAILVAYVGILVGSQLDGTIWPTHVLGQQFADAIRGVDAVIGAAVGLLLLVGGLLLYRRRQVHRQWQPTAPAIVGMTIVLVAGGFGLQQFYLRNRYYGPTTPSFVAWAQPVRNARIAVAGEYTQLQYEMYGRDLTNFVQYVGQAEPHGGYAAVASCPRWRSLLNRGHYGYVLVSTGLSPDRATLFTDPSSSTAWTSTDPASILIRRDVLPIPGVPGYPARTQYVGFSLFRIDGRLNPGSCIPSAPHV